MPIIGRIGTAGGTGHAIEFAGSTIRSLSMEARMTVCNMAIEAGARSGMVAVDDITIDYLKGRPMAPQGRDVGAGGRATGARCARDPGAKFDTVIEIDARELKPYVSWGTSPEMVATIEDRVPDPDKEKDAVRREGMERALAYMGLEAGHADRPRSRSTRSSSARAPTRASRTCARRLPWSRAGARRDSVKVAMVVPGSGLVKIQAEAEGLDKIFLDAGFEWRDPGCSMCLAMNADRLEPGERCASTSNRNFEGRQGAGGRTHLVSPAMAAAAGVFGHFVDVAEAWMRAFTVHRGLAAPLDRANVDTDAIIPKQFLKSIKRSGFGPNLFDEWRYLDHGEPGMDNSVRPLNPDFVLNKPRYKGASILVARKNFGCGSSREHAPWALEDYGFRCVIAPSFADIFFNNCFKNGLLPIRLSESEVDRLFARYQLLSRLSSWSIDLPEQAVKGPNGELIASVRDRRIPQALPGQRPRRDRPDAAACGKDPRLRGAALCRGTLARSPLSLAAGAGRPCRPRRPSRGRCRRQPDTPAPCDAGCRPAPLRAGAMARRCRRDASPVIRTS